MLITKEKLQHINCIAHEGKVVVVATDNDGKIWYTVKQDGFEDSYLNQKEEERTGWEGWKLLELPNEADDKSVLEKEQEDFTYQSNSSQYILRSRYKTQDQSAVAPVQLISGLGYLYIFRQSKSNTLLVDRFVLDGLANTLTRKLEVRFKRSKQKHKPSQSQKKNQNGLGNIDSLDYADINRKNFYEPTTELSLINKLQNGWFSVVLLPTSEQDKQRWHIFAYNSDTGKVELTTLRASQEGLFDVKDYTILDPELRQIPGIIKRTLDLGNVTITNGLSATKYDLQKERETEEEDENGQKIKQLLRESVRVMLAVGTNTGNVTALSFAAAADGTLSQINETPTTTIARSFSREILLPSNTLDAIKVIGQTAPPPQGQIIGMARGEKDAVVLTSDKATQLDPTKITEVKITEIEDYNRLYSQVTKIDDNTFEINNNPRKGNWEVIPPEETGLIYNGIVTAYEITSTGKLRVTAFNHGLGNGDEVQIVDSKNYNGTYTVTKIDEDKFSLDSIRWQAGTAISGTLQSKKRRGITFDGVADYISLPPLNPDFSQGLTVEAWVWYDGFNSWSRIIDFGNGVPDNNIMFTNQGTSNTLELTVCQDTTAQRIVATGILETGKWMHLAATIDRSGNAKLYKNGIQIQTGQVHLPKNVSRTKNYIAKSNWGQDGYFKGKISDVRIWNKSRTAEEIKNSMYLQLTGQEVGLVGYWRLDAIIEGKERKVIDFSVNGNDGIVHGGAYVSAVTLGRNLPGTSTPAIKYENEDLFAVSERGTYLEEFEFKTNSNVDPNNADGQNGKIFALTYKGKKSRYSEDWITITAQATEFTSLDNNWYKASSRFTVPDGVSLVRSFGISNFKGNWQTLEIRHHKVQLVSDSITEEKYTDDLTNLTTLEDKQVQLQDILKQLAIKEYQEESLLKEKKELKSQITLLSLPPDEARRIKQEEIDAQQKIVNDATVQQDYWNTEQQNGQKSITLYEHRNFWGKKLPKGLGWHDIGIIRGWNDIVSSVKVPRGLRVTLYEHGNFSGRTLTLVSNRSYVGKEMNDRTSCIKVETLNGNTDISYIERQLSQWNDILAREKAKLDQLNQELGDINNKDKKLAMLKPLLDEVDGQLSTIQTELNTLNTNFIDGIQTTQQTPQKMPPLKTDDRGLVTQGAVLGFVRPVSLINAIETCEGNVQLSYFDDQGRMRQTNFDATSDSNNAPFGQWIPDSLRTCLNFNNTNSEVILETPVYLGGEWTMEAWFAYPLPDTSGWHTLTRGKDADHHIIVKRESNLELLGICNSQSVMKFNGKNNYISCPDLNPDFSQGITVEAWVWYDSFNSYSRIIDFGNGNGGDNIIFSNQGTSDNLAFTIYGGGKVQEIVAKEKLETGKWMHLVATIDSSGKAKLYKNGNEIATGQVHLPKNVKRTQNYIGKSNWSGDGYFKGKISDVRISNKARTQQEIQADLNIRLMGEESGLVAYYPLNQTTVVNLVDNRNGTVTGAQLAGDIDLSFVSSGYDMKQLSPGWHHLTAVAQGKDKEAKTIFYINGQKVGESKGKTTSNVYAMGNNQEGSQQFGKVAEVRIWDIALSEAEIAVNSKTLLTGNEPRLLAYYPFNKATGTIIRDQTGNGYNGTIQGASWWGCAAPIGNLGHQVMQFDGVNDYIEIANSEGINFSKDQNFTIEAWIKVDLTQQDTENNNNAIIEKWLGTGGYPYAIRYLNKDGKVVVHRYDGTNNSRIDSKATVNDGQFHHVAFVKMGLDLLLYIDGDSSTKGGTTRDTTTGTTSNDFTLCLGCRGGKTNFFKGQIPDVRIWNKARTQQEIQADMNKRLTGKECGLVAYYPLNSTKREDSKTKVLDLVNNRHGTVIGALLVSDDTLPIGRDSNALVSCEYSTVSKDRTAMMRRFFATPTSQGVNLLPDQRIEQLELKWIGNGQFAPTLLGYIEGAPPIPSENLTLEEGYDGATSVELTLSEDVEFNWKRSQDVGLGSTAETFIGADVEASAGFGFQAQVAKIRSGVKGNRDSSYQSQNESSITAGSSLSMTDKLELVGTQEQNALFPHLGQRFIPKNIGYALVVSALSDVFITRLKRTGKMIGYQVLPVEGIPLDVNTITFLINPAYTMSGSLDGMTGSSATSQRFYKHVPEMRSQFGSLYPASYYRLQEAYDLKNQIDQQDKEREAYFAQFNSLLVDETSLDRETNKGNAPVGISVNSPEDKPGDGVTDEEKKAKEKEKQAKLEKEAKAAQDKQSNAEKKKRAEIEQSIKDQEKKVHATASFAAWQKRMEDIQIRAGKRNIVNTYVWDADGGLHAEAQSFANTAEHSIGGSFSLSGALGVEGNFSGGAVAVELTTQATISLTQSMNKTETRSKGIQLNVDLSGVENRGVTDYNDYPILSGEKVDRYRFMSFYLEGSTNNFHDFFSYVVDPEWLASNSEEARALRQAKGKANKAWRVLHRVTYVERPALMGFGRDVRELPPADSTTDLGQLQAKIDKLEQENDIIQRKLDTILNKLDS